MIKIALVFYFISIAYSMFETQVGDIDWFKLHIGEIKDVCFIKGKSHAYYITQNGIFGLVNVAKGSIEWRKEIGENTTLKCVENYALTITDGSIKSWAEKGVILVQDQIEEGDATIYFDNRLITVITNGKNIQLFENSKLQFNMNLNQATETIKQLYYHENSSTLFVIKQTVSNEIIIDKAIISANKEDIKLQKVYESKAFKEIDQLVKIQDFLIIVSAANKAGISKATVFDYKQLKEVATIPDFSQDLLFSKDSNVLYMNSQDSIILKPLLNTLSATEIHIGAKCSQVLNGQVSTSDEVRVAVSCDDSFSIFSFNIKNEDRKELLKSSQLVKSKNGGVKGFWMSDDHGYLIQFQDLSLLYVNKQLKKVWEKEEALSAITDLKFVEIVPIDENVSSSVLSFNYIREYEPNNENIALVPFKILRRLTDHFTALISFMSNPVRMFNFFKNELIQSQTHYFQKIVIASTQVQKLIAINSIDGETIWSLYLQNESVFDFFVVKRTSHGVVTDKLILISKDEQSKYKIRTLNPYTGEILHIQDVNIKGEIKAAIKVPTHSKNDMTVLINNEYQAEIYPEELHQHKSDLNMFFFEDNKIFGIKNGERVWNINLGPETFISYTSYKANFLINSGQSAQPTSSLQGAILFKLLDRNMFAFATKTEKDILMVYFVNSLTGDTLYKFSEKNVDFTQPISLLLDENNLYVSYQRQNNNSLNTQEIQVVEFYEETIQRKTTAVMKGENLGDEYSSYSQPSAQLIQQGYVFPKNIKTLGVTQTTHAITSKEIILLLEDNTIYGINKNMLSPRRPIPKQFNDGSSPARALENEEYPPYDAMIPLIPTKQKNYFTPLLRMKAIECSPSKLESTSLMIVYGQDMFFQRVSPEKVFDMLNDDFNYLLLGATVLGITVGTIASWLYSQRNKLKDTFLRR